MSSGVEEKLRCVQGNVLVRKCGINAVSDSILSVNYYAGAEYERAAAAPTPYIEMPNFLLIDK